MHQPKLFSYNTHCTLLCQTYLRATLSISLLHIVLASLFEKVGWCTRRTSVFSNLSLTCSPLYITAYKCSQCFHIFVSLAIFLIPRQSHVGSCPNNTWKVSSLTRIESALS